MAKCRTHFVVFSMVGLATFSCGKDEDKKEEESKNSVATKTAATERSTKVDTMLTGIADDFGFSTTSLEDSAEVEGSGEVEGVDFALPETLETGESCDSVYTEFESNFVETNEMFADLNEQMTILAEDFSVPAEIAEYYTVEDIAKGAEYAFYKRITPKDTESGPSAIVEVGYGGTETTMVADFGINLEIDAKNSIEMKSVMKADFADEKFENNIGMTLKAEDTGTTKGTMSVTLQGGDTPSIDLNILMTGDSEKIDAVMNLTKTDTNTFVFSVKSTGDQKLAGKYTFTKSSTGCSVDKKEEIEEEEE